MRLRLGAAAALVKQSVRVSKGRDADARWWKLSASGAATGLKLGSVLPVIIDSIEPAMIADWLKRGLARDAAGRALGPDHALVLGEEIRLAVELPDSDPGRQYTPPKLDIVWLDEAMMAVNKPTGQLPHPAGKAMNGTLLNQVQEWLLARGRPASEAHLINRIDKDTSGIVLLGLGSAAAANLARAQLAGRFHKVYQAICVGRPTPDAGEWTAPLGSLGEHTIARGVLSVENGGQAARTSYRVLASTPGDAYSRIELILHTGRQHQIRVHAAHAGCPLVGDWVYGNACTELPGQALHAATLDLPHPTTTDGVHISAPFPPALEDLWRLLLRGGKPSLLSLTDEQREKLGQGDAAAKPRFRKPNWADPALIATLNAELHALGRLGDTAEPDASSEDA